MVFISYQRIADMCDLSNDEVLERWQECNRRNRPQGAEYWHDFMVKRVQCGRKGSKDVLCQMDAIGNK